jgi:uncharacterized membrane protein
MQGKATLAGHPLHPIFITFPIGCFVAAVLCDIISIWTGPAFWAPMSAWLLLFGFLGVLPAAFFGFIDYLTAPMTTQAKSVAVWHMTINIAVFFVFGIACVLRFLDHTSVAGYAMTGLGIALLAVAASLGGNLAHDHLVGSSERDAGTVRGAVDSTTSTPEHV